MDREIVCDSATLLWMRCYTKGCAIGRGTRLISFLYGRARVETHGVPRHATSMRNHKRHLRCPGGRITEGERTKRDK